MGKLISKLSSKNIDCTPNVEMLIKAKDKKMHLYNIVGIVKKLVVGESSYGEYTKFVGQFQATRADGESFISGVLFLPKAAEEAIIGQFEQKDIQNIQFGFAIGAEYNEEAQVKYNYTCEPLFEAEENDPLKALEQRIKTAS